MSVRFIYSLWTLFILSIATCNAAGLWKLGLGLRSINISQTDLPKTWQRHDLSPNPMPTAQNSTSQTPNSGTKKTASFMSPFWNEYGGPPLRNPHPYSPYSHGQFSERPPWLDVNFGAPWAFPPGPGYHGMMESEGSISRPNYLSGMLPSSFPVARSRHHPVHPPDLPEFGPPAPSYSEAQSPMFSELPGALDHGAQQFDPMAISSNSDVPGMGRPVMPGQRRHPEPRIPFVVPRPNHHHHPEMDPELYGHPERMGSGRERHSQPDGMPAHGNRMTGEDWLNFQRYIRRSMFMPDVGGSFGSQAYSPYGFGGPMPMKHGSGRPRPPVLDWV